MKRKLATPPSTTYDIMDQKKLDRITLRIMQARRSPQKARDLERIANQLGRTKVNRGKEPTWESDLPGRPPLSIPHHGGRDIAIGTRNSILDFLEDDVMALQEILDQE
jgi:hypothetical protein